MNTKFNTNPLEMDDLMKLDAVLCEMGAKLHGLVEPEIFMQFVDSALLAAGIEPDCMSSSQVNPIYTGDYSGVKAREAAYAEVFGGA